MDMISLQNDMEKMLNFFRKSYFYDPLPINDIINRQKSCFILPSLL